MEEKKQKKPKKKVSMSATIRRLRIQNENLSSNEDYWREKCWKAEKQLSDIYKYIPLKFFRIEFKAKATDGSIGKWKEIIQGVCAEHAITHRKIGLNNFELVDLELLA